VCVIAFSIYICIHLFLGKTEKMINQSQINQQNECNTQYKEAGQHLKMFSVFVLFVLFVASPPQIAISWISVRDERVKMMKFIFLFFEMEHLQIKADVFLLC
jgi:hypothetical protein